VSVRSTEDYEALRESEEKFRILAEASFEGIFMLEQGRIAYASPRGAEMFGFTPEEMVGLDPLDLAAPESRDAVREHVSKGLPGAYEAIGVRKDGSRFVGELRGRVMSYRGRSVRVTVIRDLTEQRRIEARLRQADRMATIGMIAAGVAHEINNPLTYVQLIVQSLERQIPTLALDAGSKLQLAARLAEAAEGLERVGVIVRDLRELSHPREESSTTADVVALLDATLKIAAHEIRGRARVVTSYETVPPVRGSSDRLGQVFLNLIVNAAQAVPHGDVEHNEIRVTAKRSGTNAVIEISDTGQGIPPELQAKIFDPFVTTKAAGVGSGLGLSIVQSILDSLGGSIQVTSEVGKGSCFTVKLPLAE
jgi:PAS domain S-box-containing protein